MSNSKPAFPIVVTWLEDSEQETFKNEVDAACTLEWFDSRDSDQGVTVVDDDGKPVTLVVEATEIKLCHLA